MDDNRTTRSVHPSRLGEDFVEAMRSVSDSMENTVLYDARLEELVRMMRRFEEMTAQGLNEVLGGVHDALQNLLNELIP